MSASPNNIFICIPRIARWCCSSQGPRSIYGDCCASGLSNFVCFGLNRSRSPIKEFPSSSFDTNNKKGSSWYSPLRKDVAQKRINPLDNFVGLMIAWRDHFVTHWHLRVPHTHSAFRTYIHTTQLTISGWRNLARQNKREVWGKSRKKVTQISGHHPCWWELDRPFHHRP